MNIYTFFSSGGIGAIIRLSIQIGLLLFTTAFFSYLLYKSRKWFHFVAVLISTLAGAFPLIKMYNLFQAAGGTPYSSLRLHNLEHLLINSMLLLFALLVYLRREDLFTAELQVAQTGSLISSATQTVMTGLDKLVLVTVMIASAVLIGAGAAFPRGIVTIGPEGVASRGVLAWIRDALLVSGAGYYMAISLFRKGLKRDLLLRISISVGLALLLTVYILDMFPVRGLEQSFLGAAFTLLTIMMAFILVREYLDRASRTRNIESELAYLETHDPLTRLENRRQFFSALNEICRNQGAIGGQTPLHAVLQIDIDYFGNINESLGNDAGNEILNAIAKRFSASLGNQGRLYRTGGDEFGILISEVGSELDVAMISERLLEVFQKQFEWDWHSVYLSASIGISMFPRDGLSIADITSHADQALQEAKLDRNTYRFYTPAMQERAVGKIQMINYLRQAVDRRELSLHYQPQLDGAGNLVGAEALLRWNHGVLGSVSPAEFIPVAEETGLIIPIGTWVIEEACKTLVLWRSRGLSIPVSINLSPRQLRDGKLQRTLISNLRMNSLDPRSLHLEITENSLVEDQDGLISKLQNMADIGLKFSIDDFGTGYSSLSYLKRLPIAAVKIDRSFVIDLPFDSQNSALVQAIISMVQGMGYRVVAEGVDNAEQLNFLLNNNCDIIQGFYHSKPLSGDHFLEFARERQNA